MRKFINKAIASALIVLMSVQATAYATRGYVYDSADATELTRISGALAYCDVWAEIIDEVTEIPTGEWEWQLWDADDWGQTNPMRTDIDGNYGWLVPSGIYRIRVVHDDYNDYVSALDDDPSKGIEVPPGKSGVNIRLTFKIPEPSPSESSAPSPSISPTKAPSTGGGGGGGIASTPSPSPSATPEVTAVPTSAPAGEALLKFEFNADVSYISGYKDGSFRAQSGATRAEIAVILHRLITASDKNNPVEGKFSDVNSGAWYTQAVNYLANAGVVGGYDNDTFLPDNEITRAEFITIIAKVNGIESENKNIFPDIGAGFWAEKYIYACYDKGWVGGYPEGVFLPDNIVTRAEVVTIINRMLGKNINPEDYKDILSPFTDLEQGHWAYASILEATK